MTFTEAHSPTTGQTFADSTGLAGGGVVEEILKLAKANRRVNSFKVHIIAKEREKL
jgi:hypothetical protein